MKILHITPAYFPSIGGIETSVRDLAAHLNRTGIVADVLHMSPSNTVQRQERLDASTVWRVPLSPSRHIGLTPSIRPVLMNYDLLHVHDPQGMAVSANIFVQGRGKKMVLSTHGGYFHTNNHGFIKALHWRYFAGSILKHYDEVLASSTHDREVFKAKAPRVKLVPNGINAAKFLAVERTTVLPPTRWIYWGRLSKNKRIDLLLDTMKYTRDAGLAVDLVIAGRDFDGLIPSIKSRISSHGLDEHVRIAGPLSDNELIAELAGRTVFITASEYEGFGLSVLEAMAAGLIVICRNMAPLDNFVVNGRNGALINFDGSASDLRSIMAVGWASITETLAMQQYARDTAIQHSWDAVLKKYTDIYSKLLRM
jgi:alpha-1,3-mannosyltransferase